MKNNAIYISFLQKISPKNQYWPKIPINFFGSGVFALGRSGYLKHEYFFARPKEGSGFFILKKLQYHPYIYIPPLDFASVKGMDGPGFLENIAVSIYFLFLSGFF